MSTENKLPECPYYVAHPQAVWFNEHWRPVIEQLKAEKEKLKSLFSVQLDVMEQNNNMTTEITALKSKLAKAKEALEFYGSPKTYFYVEHPDGLEGRGDITVMKDLGSKAINALSEIGEG